MTADERKKQHRMIVSKYDLEGSTKFKMVTGIVESEKGDIIVVKGKRHDITKAMIINEKGNILREGNIQGEGDVFQGREVVILYHLGKVISVKLL